MTRSTDRDRIHIDQFTTTWGTIRTASTPTHLYLMTLPSTCTSTFEDGIEQLFPGAAFLPAGPISQQVRQQVIAYFRGELRRFTVPYRLACSDFQARALREVARVPYGQTRTYGQIAATIGHPNAYRAVGTANACNRIPLIIPCHRIVASTGIGGYGGGESLKARLLSHEGAAIVHA